MHVKLIVNCDFGLFIVPMNNNLVLLQVANLCKISVTYLALERPDSSMLSEMIFQIAWLFKKLVTSINQALVVEICLIWLRIYHLNSAKPFFRDAFEVVFVGRLIILDSHLLFHRSLRHLHLHLLLILNLRKLKDLSLLNLRLRISHFSLMNIIIVLDDGLCAGNKLPLILHTWQ